MKRINKHFFTVLLAVILLLTSNANAFAVSEGDLWNKYNSTAAYFQTLPTPNVGSIGGEWLAMGLARAGLLSDKEKVAYYNNVVSAVKEAGSNKLHGQKATENARVVIALSSIGKDARNVEGYDLTEPLNNFTYVKKQGINGLIWSLIALDCCRYESDIRESLITEILDRQLENGGWNLGVGSADADITAMAIQALAPYHNFDKAVSSAIDNAFKFLSSINISRISPETCSQIIVAHTSMGFNPDSTGVFEQMMSYSVTNGFEHTKGNGYNQMATEQCFYAITSYKRFLNGQTSLYKMTDVEDYAVFDLNNDGAVNIEDVTYLQKYLAELEVTLTVSQKKLADVNNDCFIGIKDATALQIILAER